jgi:chemotaxis protein CheY-P-specific phosphatase CheC
MKDARKEFLKTLQATLEQFAFAFSEEDSGKSISNCSEPFIHACIMFSGSRDAAITLTAPEALCSAMAGNILGMEPDEVAEDLRADTLKEIANIACGGLIPALFGDMEKFNIAIPSAVRINKQEWLEFENDPAIVRLWIENEPLLAKLAVTGKI